LPFACWKNLAGTSTNVANVTMAGMNSYLPNVLEKQATAPANAMHVDEKDGREILICKVKNTILHYNISCLEDFYQMLNEHGD